MHYYLRLFLEICLIPGGIIIHVRPGGATCLVSNDAGRINVNEWRICPSGNIYEINSGCGDERKKFAYDFYFGILYLRNWIVTPSLVCGKEYN
jgi:hypothetical protein